jgi:hypothetical protein
MDALFWFNVLTRWLHVASAVVGVGAFVFLGLVLYPALKAQDAAVRQAVTGQVLPRVRRLVHWALGLLLLTGFYNYLVVSIPKVRAEGIGSLYHPVIGIKILLALALFGTATAALSFAPVSDNMQARRERWVTVNIIMAVVILLLSAFLRRLWA